MKTIVGCLILMGPDFISTTELQKSTTYLVAPYDRKSPLDRWCSFCNTLAKISPINIVALNSFRCIVGRAGNRSFGLC